MFKQRLDHSGKSPSRGQVAFTERNRSGSDLKRAMHGPIHDKTIRKRRESHGAVMLVGLLMTILLAGAVFVVVENAPVFKAATPTVSPLEADDSNPE